MAARRFFVEGTSSPGSSVEIAGSDAHKIVHVLRLNAGDEIEVIDSASIGFTATIESVGRTVRAKLLEEISGERKNAERWRIDVAQAIPKGRRMDFVIEKCTELGACAFLPFHSERSVVIEIGNEKHARWERLARTAAAQCGRREVPEIAGVSSFEKLLERFGEYDAVFFAWELAGEAPLHERLGAALPPKGRILVVVGPEGGFTHVEAERAQGCGATVIGLGSRILRTDTAAMVLMAVIGAFAS